MKGFCDRNLHPAAKQAKGHKALDATAWTPKSALVFSLKKLLAEHIMFSTKGQKPGKQITVSSILPKNERNSLSWEKKMLRIGSIHRLHKHMFLAFFDHVH